MNRSLLVTTLLLLTAVVLFTTCIKEYSREGLPATAAYTFLGAGSACTNAVVNGSYYSGTQLTQANTVQLQVNVTVAGSYNVSTNSSNGIYFTGSGNFTDTGTQSITLTGSGTPVDTGNVAFNTPDSSSCSFIINVTGKPVTYASYTIAGDPDACVNAIVNGNYIYGTDLTTANTIVLQVNVASAGPYTISTDTLDGISFSASGTFTTTGIHQVTLNGHGKTGQPMNLSFHVAGDSTSCSLDLSVVNPEPLATYVLESDFGTPNPCNHTILGGSYTAGTPLDASNTISIRVGVVKVGNFTVSTDLINGMQFSLTGTFTTTGDIDITLKGTGTPTAVGTFGLTPQIVGPHPLGGQTCAVGVDVK